MEQPNELVIKSRKKNKILFLLLVLIFFYLACKNIFSLFESGETFSLGWVFSGVFSLLLASFTFYLAVYTIRRLFDKRPGLILNQLGIHDNSGIVAAGFIGWSEVVEINSRKLFLADTVQIKVKHPTWVIRHQKNVLERTWLGIENRYWGSPVHVSVEGAKIKFNHLFSALQQRFLSSHVESRTLELKKEKDVIQREKLELINSINYAKRIQTALLPSHASIRKHLGENFILFLPKDIVSGDFLWIESVDEWVFFAGCDCTGHGVPGALMSIVCNNALTRAVKEFNIVQPSKILDKVAELIVESMGMNGEVRDGMDASLCAFNKNTRELFWAGANIPLWIARESFIYELLEFKPDKQAVGLVENRLPYTNHKIEVKKGDIIYLFSDGYADQFGGFDKKKLTRKKFKELLMKQRGQSLSKQHDYLLKFHNDYRKNTEQIDDILVVGISVEN